VALPGQTIDDIKEVYSHPMAILQCQKFFEDYPDIKLIDSNDTALSAKKIQNEKLKNIGAIASRLANEKYGLEILFAGIETNKKNYTRFLILGEKNGDNHPSVVNKSSLHFTVSHKFGSLAKVLTTFSFYNINLSKIQSMPIVGKEWQYQFYADVEFDDYEIYRQSLEAVKLFTGELNILGEYKKGKSIKE
jgi:prephenate dehydratase